VARQDAASAPGAGGGYSFTPEQIEDMLRRCDNLIDRLQHEGRQAARLIQQARPPAPDTAASVPHADAVVALGHRVEQRMVNQIAFIEHWRDQLAAVRQNYLDQEGHTVASWKALSGGLFT
jgi:hypothetical protein